jgi:hypothetical protein
MRLLLAVLFLFITGCLEYRETEHKPRSYGGVIYIIKVDNHEYVSTGEGICHKINCKYCRTNK